MLAMRGAQAEFFKAADPNTEALYAGTQDGLYRSTDEGENWTRVPGASCVYSLAFVATSPTTIYAGGCGTGVWESVERRAIGIRKANEKDINNAVKQIEKDRKKDQQ